jgi:hypothetical protein
VNMAEVGKPGRMTTGLPSTTARQSGAGFQRDTMCDYTRLTEMSHDR